MKYIKMFLASSVTEFQQEQHELGDFIRSLNDIYTQNNMDIYLELSTSGDFAAADAAALADCRPQICGSQFFYVLFGRMADRAAVEQFDTAIKQNRVSGDPQIYTYFVQIPEGERAEQGVYDFMQRLDEQLGHYYSTFSHLDSVKLNILIELARKASVQNVVTFEDGQALLNGQKALSLENVPLYSKNESVQRLTHEKKELDQKFSELVEECGRHQDKSRFRDQISDLDAQRKQVADQLHQLEKDILNLCREITEKQSSGRKMNWREKQAIQLMEKGDSEGARMLLHDPVWKQEIVHAEENIETEKEKIREYISGKRTLISNLKTNVNAENARKITDIYAEITQLAEKYQMELDVLMEYARFLYDQRQYPGMGV